MSKYEYAVAATPESAYYTRYPGGSDGWPTEAEDLVCPKCGDDQITILKESGADGMLGDTAQCWTCKHEFIVTDNCWRHRRIKNG